MKQREIKLRKAIQTAWKKMQDRTFEYTMKGKNNPSEVSQKDWNNASFTIEELENEIVKNYVEL